MGKDVLQLHSIGLFEHALEVHGSLDQSTGPKARDPSLNDQTGCLIVVDTFRHDRPIAARRIASEAPIL
jgi:hypothetical protein